MVRTGRITIGDIAIGGTLTAVFALCIMGATAFILYLGLGFSEERYLIGFMITVSVFFIVGGIIMGKVSRKAGYPVLTTLAWGAAVIMAIFAVTTSIWVLEGGGLEGNFVLWLLAVMTILILGLFFDLGLAGFLNARYQGMPTQRTFGTKPGGWVMGAPIYKSNQPSIYQGIRELDFDDKAPGTLYRRRQ